MIDANTAIAVTAMAFAAMGLLALPRRMELERSHRDETDHLRHLAHHDPLTGLPNRNMLRDRLEGALARAARNTTQVAFLALDLDQFKPVNDVHGHEAGDEVLRLVAAALTDSVRAGDTAARVGGDEFAVLQEGGEQPFAAMLLAERVRESIRRATAGDERMRGISASIGVAIYPDDSVDASMLRRQADMALYRAKALGRDRCSIYAETEASVIPAGPMLESMAG